MARGHAGNDLICNTITAIVECMAVNIEGCWDVKLRRKDNSGDYDLRWDRECRNSRGLERANRAAGFAYNGLAALAEEYPENVWVEWVRAANDRPYGERRDGGPAPTDWRERNADC